MESFQRKYLIIRTIDFIYIKLPWKDQLVVATLIERLGYLIRILKTEMKVILLPTLIST